MKKRVVILGAGVTGLSAAYRLSQFPECEVHVLEKEMEVGGFAEASLKEISHSTWGLISFIPMCQV